MAGRLSRLCPLGVSIASGRCAVGSPPVAQPGSGSQRAVSVLSLPTCQAGQGLAVGQEGPHGSREAWATTPPLHLQVRPCSRTAGTLVCTEGLSQEGRKDLPAPKVLGSAVFEDVSHMWSVVSLTRMCMHTYKHTQVHSHTNAHTSTLTHIPACTHVLSLTCVHACTRKHTPLHAHTGTHPHAHSQARSHTFTQHTLIIFTVFRVDVSPPREMGPGALQLHDQCMK